MKESDKAFSIKKFVLSEFSKANREVSFEYSARGDTRLKLGVRVIGPKDFEKEIRSIMAKLEKEKEYKTLLEIEKVVENFGKEFKAMSDKLYASIVKDAKKKAEMARKNKAIASLDYLYDNHYVVTDVLTNDKILFDGVKKEATGLNVETYQEWVKKQPKAIREIHYDSERLGLVQYEPFNSTGVGSSILRGQKVNKFNSHAMPSWRKKEIGNPSPPKNFLTFMNTFFPEEESREYVFQWMRSMLVGRNEVHLLLHGAKGVGKNTLAEICEALVGRPNFKLIDPQFWNSRFNGELKNRRLCFFDEHDITKENIAQFKAYANTYISIEEKNRNTEHDTRNFSSYIIANNNPQGNYIAPDDRRFSVPILSKIRLDDIMGEEEVSSLYDDIKENQEWIANVGWWIINKENTFKFDLHKPLKTSLFYDLCEMSLAEWKRKLISTLESKTYDKIPLSGLDVFLNIRSGRTPGRSKVAEFLMNYTDHKGRHYGSIKQITEEGRKERYIIPSSHLLPDNVFDSADKEKEDSGDEDLSYLEEYEF